MLLRFCSGQGKSSVVSLVERFYDPTSGSVLLDGVNLKDLNVEWLRSQLGLVGQEPVLFDTTIAENIRLGKPDATQGDIENAARQANAYDFIVSFPDGFDTQVGTAGTQVSSHLPLHCCIQSMRFITPLLSFQGFRRAEATDRDSPSSHWKATCYALR